MTDENSRTEQEEMDDIPEEEEYGDTDVRGAESRGERDNAVENKLDLIDDKLDGIEDNIEEMREDIAEHVVEEADEEELEDVVEDEDASDDDEDSEGEESSSAASDSSDEGVDASGGKLPVPVEDDTGSEEEDTPSIYRGPSEGDLVLITQGSTSKKLRNYNKLGIIMDVDEAENPDDTFYTVLFKSGSKSRYKERNLIVEEKRDFVPESGFGSPISDYFERGMDS